MLGGAGLASVLLGLRRQNAAADCADITTCIQRTCPPEEWCSSILTFPIPGGPYGMCWSWSEFTCNPCSTTMAELNAMCNWVDGCNGQCKASLSI
jgi:hypothetical protein